MSWHCGLCRVKVENWEEHIKSEEHQKKLRDPAFMADAFMKSQAEIIKQVKDRNGSIITGIKEAQDEENQKG